MAYVRTVRKVGRGDNPALNLVDAQQVARHHEDVGCQRDPSPGAVATCVLVALKQDVIPHVPEDSSIFWDNQIESKCLSVDNYLLMKSILLNKIYILFSESNSISGRRAAGQRGQGGVSTK